MNKILPMFGLLFLILCQFSQGLAQTQEISEQELKKITDSAYQKTIAETYRKKMNSQHFKHISDTKPHFQRTLTTEHGAEGYYEILEDKNEKGVERTETIVVNERKYVKRNNNKWEEVNASDKDRIIFGTREIPKQEETIECRYLGKQTINGQKVDVYEKKLTRKYENIEGLSVNEEKFWIDQKGRYLKTEDKSRIGDKHIFQMTVEYEYDPNIKITAPQIK